MNWADTEVTLQTNQSINNRVFHITNKRYNQQKALLTGVRKGNHCLIKNPFHKGHFNRICRHSRASISVWLRLGSDVKQQEQNEETSHCSGSFHIKRSTAIMSHSTNLGMPKLPTKTNVSEVVQSWPTIWQTDIVSHGRQVKSHTCTLSLVRFYLSGHNQSLTRS